MQQYLAYSDPVQPNDKNYAETVRYIFMQIQILNIVT